MSRKISVLTSVALALAAAPLAAQTPIEIGETVTGTLEEGEGGDESIGADSPPFDALAAGVPLPSQGRGAGAAPSGARGLRQLTGASTARPALSP